MRGVRVEEIVDDGALQLRARAAIEVETRARDLCGGVGIENTEVFAKIPVCFCLKIKLAGLVPAADLRVFGVILADGVEFVGHIRDRKERVGHLRVNGGDFVGVNLYIIGKLFHLRKNGRNVLALFFQLRNGLGNAVLLRFFRFGIGNQRAALHVQFQQAVDFLAVILLSGGKARLYFVRVFFDILNVKHLIFSFFTLL